MNLLVLSEPLFHVEITTDAPDLAFTDQYVMAFVAAARAMTAAVPLAAFDCAQDAENPSPKFYHYHFTTADGRFWDQHLIFEGEPTTTFSVEKPWRFSEITFHQALRGAVIEMILQRKVRAILIRFVQLPPPPPPKPRPKPRRDD